VSSSACTSARPGEQVRAGVQPGVVDQQRDASGGLGRRGGRGGVGDVQLDRRDPGQIDGPGLAGAGVDGRAAGDEGGGQLLAEAAVGAGDEGGGGAEVDGLLP